MNSTPTNQETKWHNQPAIIVLAAILFFPLGLFLVWRSKNIKSLWKIAFSLIIAAYGLIVIVGTVAVNSPEIQSQIRHDDSLAQAKQSSDRQATSTTVSRQPAPYFNADTLQAYFSAPPLNYYFIRHDGVGTYSTYKGYVSKEIAESEYEYGKHKSQVIEIMFNPETKEIYRARLSIKNLTSITPKPNELKYAFDFISTLSPEAAAQFQRNFSTVFCYSTKAIDSSEYINESRKIKAYVYNDLDMVAKKMEKLTNAFIEINIENTGNEYKYNEANVSQAKKERQELVEKAFSTYDGSHMKLTEYIKAHMNDPESFEHVETTYIDRPGNGYVEVKEIFRGKNAYNATILNTVWAKCKVEGEVIEIENQ